MTMRLNDPDAYRRADELEVLEELLDLRGLRVLELGCGGARMTRALVERLGARRVTATEVDRIQHDKNCAIADLPAVEFRYGAAEQIADADASYDVVCMFKSLHHVSLTALDKALTEIHRVLVPGGRLYVSEPVYWGAFNEIMRLIQEERTVRAAAFAALERAVAAGRFAAEQECFFEVVDEYPDWASFAARFMHVTHSPRDFSPTQVAEIRAAFEAYLAAHGAYFIKPQRVDLLRRLP